jgi:hypothetical protein
VFFITPQCGGFLRFHPRCFFAHRLTTKSVTISNFLAAYLFLAVVYSESSREEEAWAAAAEILRISPNFSLEGYQQRLHYKDPTVMERFVPALRKAGLK